MASRKQHNQSIHSTGTWWLGSAAVILALAVTLSIRLFSDAQKPVDLLLTFQRYHYGAVPEEFDYDATGSHGPVLSAGRPFWRIYQDRNAPSPEFVLIQAASLPEADHYPIALLRAVQAKDATISVYLKPMGGTMDKSQGLIWRLQNKDNYYAVLASTLDNQLHLLKMMNGQPQEIASSPIQIAVQFEQQAPSPTWGWYTLKVQAQGSVITVWFDGRKVIEVNDKTFLRSGRIGLITHADSVTLFDDFAVQAGSSK